MTQTAGHSFAGAAATAALLVALAACAGTTPHTAATSPAAPLAAPVPARPPVAGAGANDPHAYYTRGLAKLGLEPDSAAAAFYWASRLDPWWAEPYYARGLAILLAHLPPRGLQYAERRRVEGRLTRAQLREVDSLNVLALSRDPFLVRRLDYLLTGRPSAAARSRLRDPADAGYWAFDAEEYGEAATLLGRALAAHPESAPLRALRAQAFFHLRQYDSAGVELVQLLDTLVRRDESGPAATYRSKEMIYYALGFVRVQQGDTAAARDAFGRALAENLAFYMAHVRLAGVALAQRDTAGALRELAEAVDVNGADPALRYYYAQVLSHAGRPEDALAQLRRAVELDADFAAPYESAARIYEAAGDTAAALGAYRAFLAHAHGEDASVAPAAARVAALTALPPASVPTPRTAAPSAPGSPPPVPPAPRTP